MLFYEVPLALMSKHFEVNTISERGHCCTFNKLMFSSPACLSIWCVKHLMVKLLWLKYSATCRGPIPDFYVYFLVTFVLSIGYLFKNTAEVIAYSYCLTCRW